MWHTLLVLIGSLLFAQVAQGQDGPKKPDAASIARTIRECVLSKWNVPDAKDILRVRIQLDRQGMLSAPVEIMDPSQDPLARKAEQGAIRAIKACEPFRLLPEQHSAWEVVILTLDPRTLAVGDAKQACAQQKDPELRLKSCNQVIQDDPRAAWAYNERAWAYFKMGKAAQGLPDVEKSLELNPNFAMALDTRGHIFEALGRREEAVADFRSAFSVGGTDRALKNSSRAGLERLGVPSPPEAVFDGIATDSSRPSNITQSSESDEFGRSVVRAMKGTMPKSSTAGRMTIRLLLDEKGKLQEVRIVKNEGDAQMERMVLDAARRTRFPIPPKGSTIADRTFVVNYVYR